MPILFYCANCVYLFFFGNPFVKPAYFPRTMRAETEGLDYFNILHKVIKCVAIINSEIMGVIVKCVSTIDFKADYEIEGI